MGLFSRTLHGMIPKLSNIKCPLKLYSSCNMGVSSYKSLRIEALLHESVKLYDTYIFNEAQDA